MVSSESSSENLAVLKKQKSEEQAAEIQRRSKEPVMEKPDNLFDFDMLHEEKVDSTSVGMKWKYGLQKYHYIPRCDKKSDILKWCRRHASEFHFVVRSYFSIPATSVPAERLFSRASLTIRRHQNRLNNEPARFLLCVNNWIKNKIY